MAHYNRKNYLQLVATGLVLVASSVAANPITIQYTFSNPVYVSGLLQESYIEARVTGFLDDSGFAKPVLGNGPSYKYELTGMSVETRTRYTSGGDSVIDPFTEVATQFSSGSLQLYSEASLGVGQLNLSLRGTFVGANSGSVSLGTSAYLRGYSESNVLLGLAVSEAGNGRAILNPTVLTDLISNLPIRGSASANFTSNNVFSVGRPVVLSNAFTEVPTSNVSLPSTLSMLLLGLIAAIGRLRQ
jgi:hypothetical protein